MKQFIELLNLYPSLSESKVTTSDLGVPHRVFFNWKDKGIIDYDHKFTPEDIANNVKRKKVELNAFESLWVLIIKELRTFNIGLNTIGSLKTFLFSTPDFNFIKGLSQQDISDISNLGLPKEMNTFLSAFELDIPGMVDDVNNGPEATKAYFTNIAILVNSILLSGHSPSIFIYKKPSESDMGFEIFNPSLESKYYSLTDQDYRMELIKGLTENTIISIPIRPLFEQFFEKKALLKHSKDFDLFNPSELKVLKILKSRDFDKIIIYNNNNKEITIESSSSEQVLGEKATELRKMLGLKEYERAEVIFRNNKNLVLVNTSKQKIDLGNT
jgi:hypothetical protein